MLKDGGEGRRRARGVRGVVFDLTVGIAEKGVGSSEGGYRLGDAVPGGIMLIAGEVLV